MNNIKNLLGTGPVQPYLNPPFPDGKPNMYMGGPGPIVGPMPGTSNEPPRRMSNAEMGSAPGPKVGAKPVKSAKGNTVLMDQLNVLRGGKLMNLSPSTMEVQANDPNAVDSVELDQAYVSDNETISLLPDGTKYVFSDSLKNPYTGKTFAYEDKKLAKLEQQIAKKRTANGPHEKATLAMIDSIRQSLAGVNDQVRRFQEQKEMMNDPKAYMSPMDSYKGQYQTGGALPPEEYEYTIGPDGRLVRVPKRAPLGQRVRTQVDILRDKREALANKVNQGIEGYKQEVQQSGEQFRQQKDQEAATKAAWAAKGYIEVSKGKFLKPVYITDAVNHKVEGTDANGKKVTLDVTPKTKMYIDDKGKMYWESTGRAGGMVSKNFNPVTSVIEVGTGKKYSGNIGAVPGANQVFTTNQNEYKQRQAEYLKRQYPGIEKTPEFTKATAPKVSYPGVDSTAIRTVAEMKAQGKEVKPLTQPGQMPAQSQNPIGQVQTGTQTQTGGGQTQTGGTTTTTPKTTGPKTGYEVGPDGTTYQILGNIKFNSKNARTVAGQPYLIVRDEITGQDHRVVRQPNGTYDWYRTPAASAPAPATTTKPKATTTPGGGTPAATTPAATPATTTTTPAPVDGTTTAPVGGSATPVDGEIPLTPAQIADINKRRAEQGVDALRGTRPLREVIAENTLSPIELAARRGQKENLDRLLNDPAARRRLSDEEKKGLREYKKSLKEPMTSAEKYTALQYGELAAKAASLLQGYDRNLMNTAPISYRPMDPAQALMQNQYAYNAAAQDVQNASSGALQLASLQNLAATMGARNAEVMSKYDMANQNLYRDYEARLGQRDTENISYEHNVGQANKAAYQNAIQDVFTSVGNIGRAGMLKEDSMAAARTLMQAFQQILPYTQPIADAANVKDEYGKEWKAPDANYRSRSQGAQVPDPFIPPGQLNTQPTSGTTTSGTTTNIAPGSVTTGSPAPASPAPASGGFTQQAPAGPVSTNPNPIVSDWLKSKSNQTGAPDIPSLISSLPGPIRSEMINMLMGKGALKTGQYYGGKLKFVKGGKLKKKK